MVKFKDVIYYNPGSGDKVFLSDMKNKHIFQVPMKYAEDCKLLQFGCERNSIDVQLLRFFEKKLFISE